MKALAVLAGIKENLCYHVGRHSFASLVTLEAGVPIETISSMLGHSNIQTTQVYARVTPKKLFEDMDRLIEATGDLKLVLLPIYIENHEKYLFLTVLYLPRQDKG